MRVIGGGALVLIKNLVRAGDGTPIGAGMGKYFELFQRIYIYIFVRTNRVHNSPYKYHDNRNLVARYIAGL